MKKLLIIYPKKTSLRKSLACCAAMLFCSINLSAQQKVTQPQIAYNIIVDSVNNKIDINFDAETMIHNLLVTVSGPNSQTLFLDNQYNFQGLYHHQIDLNKYGKGTYYLNIINDEERINKKIIVKK